MKQAVPTTVVFTGAGASKPFGLYLTRELMEEIRRMWKRGTLFSGSHFRDYASIDDLTSELEELLPGIQSPQLDPPMITDILSLIDFSLQTEVAIIDSRAGKRLSKLRELLNLALVDVLWAEKPRQRPLLKRIGRWLASDASRDFGFVSTNYDVLFEQALFDELDSGEVDREDVVAERIDFGIPWRSIGNGEYLFMPPADPTMRWYKLHGSLNWLRCDRCEHVYINVFGPIAALGGDDSRKTYNNSCHCEYWPLRHMLVAPSFIREMREINLLQIWQRTLEMMRRADHWIILGYSLPPEDISIRSLLIRAYRGHTGKRKPVVTVVQAGDPNADLEARFRMLFADNCRFDYGGADAFLVAMIEDGRSDAAR